MSDGEGSASGDLGRRKSLDAAKAGVSVAFKELRESGEVTSESGVEFLRKIEDKVEEAFLQVSDWLSEGGFAAVPFMFRSSLMLRGSSQNISPSRYRSSLRAWPMTGCRNSTCRGTTM